MNSKAVIEIISIYEPKLKLKLEKLFNRDLRNKIAHEDYIYKNDKIIYNDKNWIGRDTLFQIIMNLGIVVNSLQTFEFKNRKDSYEKIVKLKLSKKNIKSFYEKYNI